jgi:hypothetical protein
VATPPAVEDGDPLRGAVLSQAHLKALVRHANEDKADTGPRAEPPGEQLAARGRATGAGGRPKSGNKGGLACLVPVSVQPAQREVPNRFLGCYPAHERDATDTRDRQTVPIRSQCSGFRDEWAVGSVTGREVLKLRCDLH